MILGQTLVYSALLLRLLRTFKIFNTFKKMGPYWKNKYMIVGVVLLCSFNLFILILWTALDSLKMVTTLTYHAQSRPQFYERLSICGSSLSKIWLSLCLAYNGVIMAVVVVLAILTRKIRRSNFKDTKKINGFIAMISVTYVLIMVLYTFQATGKYVLLRYYIILYSFSSNGIYCQLFVFLPKVFIIVRNLRLGRVKKSCRHGSSVSSKRS